MIEEDKEETEEDEALIQFRMSIEPDVNTVEVVMCSQPLIEQVATSCFNYVLEMIDSDDS
jgi:hypothetical protein